MHENRVSGFAAGHLDIQTQQQLSGIQPLHRDCGHVDIPRRELRCDGEHQFDSGLLAWFQLERRRIERDLGRYDAVAALAHEGGDLESDGNGCGAVVLQSKWRAHHRIQGRRQAHGDHIIRGVRGNAETVQSIGQALVKGKRLVEQKIIEIQMFLDQASQRRALRRISAVSASSSQFHQPSGEQAVRLQTFDVHPYFIGQQA